MSVPGIAVLAKELFYCGKAQEDAMADYVGATIAGLVLSREGGICDDGADGSLAVTLTDGRSFMLYDAGRSCCEVRYMTCDDDLAAFVGASIVGAEVRDGGSSEDEYGEPHEQQFVIFKTSLGEFTVATHNEHNGYYGGFWLQIKDTTREEGEE
jgi:hypothetical protein